MRQQHKHYYCIRAYADGWNIESKSSVGWEHIPRPFFDEDREYRVVPDEDGWLPWYGGKCPLDGTVMVEVKYMHDIAGASNYANIIRWGHLYTAGDVIAYRVIKEVDPYAELKAAAKDPTKVIVHLPSTTVHEYPACVGFNFTDEPACYEIRDKPKKIKLLAWVEANGNLNWRKEGYEYGPCWTLIWKRIPSEDKEIEVEE